MQQNIIRVRFYRYEYHDKYLKFLFKLYFVLCLLDSDLLQQRLSAMEASRQKMQEQYIKSTLIAKEKEEEVYILLNIKFVLCMIMLNV